MVVAGLMLAGCNKSAGTAVSETKVAGGKEHGEWWCDEHGVPEEICAQCNVKLVADFKAKGDWCKEHDRPDSQCFICHPEKEAEFAAQYEAKYGKKPPKPDSDAAKQDHKDEAKHI
jgi:cobalt-zinc-cadmium efflux system membrane fusion protein